MLFMSQSKTPFKINNYWTSGICYMAYWKFSEISSFSNYYLILYVISKMFSHETIKRASSRIFVLKMLKFKLRIWMISEVDLALKVCYYPTSHIHIEPIFIYFILLKIAQYKHEPNFLTTILALKSSSGVPLGAFSILTLYPVKRIWRQPLNPELS